MSNNGSEKSKLLFIEGETVLCYHGPLLYEAKCVKSELKNKTPSYLVHYSGWNKSWDEWVEGPRILKSNEENLKKQTELFATHGTSKIASKIKSNSRKSVANSMKSTNPEKSNEYDKSSNGIDGDEKEGGFLSAGSAVLRNNSTTSSNGSDSKKKRQKLDDEKDEYIVKSDISIKINDELKAVLQDDYHNIVTQTKLVKLPSAYTVEMILEDYSTYKIKKQFDRNILASTIEALKNHFNSTLPLKLLYNFEKLQYIEVIKDSNKKPTEIYGGMHFLRLFTEISRSLSYTYWDEICTKQLILHIEDFLKYITEHRSKVFSSKMYFNPPVSYTQKAPAFNSTSIIVENPET